MSLFSQQNQFLADFAQLIIFIQNDLGCEVSGEWLFRDEATQQRMVNQGLSKTMNSKHRQKCAADLNIKHPETGEINPSDLCMLAGEFWESLYEGNTSGAVSWGWDYGHFERDPNYKPNNT